MNTLRRFAVVAFLAALAIAANVSGILPGVAEAAPKWKASLATDGGATSLTQVWCESSINSTMVLQSTDRKEFAFRTCPTVSCTAVTKDFRPFTSKWNGGYTAVTDGGLNAQTQDVLNQTQPDYVTAPIEMGLDKCINAIALDGGTLAGLNVFQMTSNPK